MTQAEIIEDNIDIYVRAYFPPEAPTMSYQIYGFLRQNSAHVIVAGGMSHAVLGMDRVALSTLAPYHGLEYDRIIPFINKYESAILKKQAKAHNGS